MAEKNKLVIHIKFNLIHDQNRRGYIARRRRTKISLFVSTFRGAHSKTYSNYYSTKNELWLLLIGIGADKREIFAIVDHSKNAVIRENRVSYSYSRLIHDLYKKQLLLNRKYSHK
ncbi:hypothetical protein GIB67_030559 [Kingdonia uniflora]|uniref:Large ribosomal subunit protein bL20c n=1 Tax=Kingdonia uniflora TaxID=39325 RepID=A0A7J7P4U9_9MAGN|nr:hypothetical protein GIB67_030559 [Kingdonia uniflora]